MPRAKKAAATGEASTPPPSNFILLERGLIQPGSNDRKQFDEGELRKLALSIAQYGLAQPITVRPIRDAAGALLHYQIVAGERRFRAHGLIPEVARERRIAVADCTHIPALVRELGDEEAAAIMLVENTARVDLDPIAEGDAFRVRADQFGWSTAQIAETAGVSEGRVKDRLLLLQLAEDVQHFVRTHALPIGHALLLVELDKNRQRIALRVYNASASMPLHRFREVVARLAEDQASEAQGSLFALELLLMEDAADDALSQKGKLARTGAPTNKHLPPVRIAMTDSVGDILDRHIQELLLAGADAEAAALGNLYNTLVAFNWTSVPAGSALAKSGSVDTADTAAHYVRIK